MSALLVTGGAGFIGSNFIRYYLARHPKATLINLDKLTYAGNLDNLADLEANPRYRFVRGDIGDPAVVGPLVAEADRIINFAAETHVDRSIVAADDFIKTDVYGTFVLLEAARESKQLRRFVHISTDEVYGDAGAEPSHEESPLNPRSPYAASKAGADRLAFSYWATYGAPVVITRCGNNYGPYQYPEKLIPFFVTNALQDQPLPMYGDGTNVRDWIHVLDHCAALDLLLHRDGVEGEVFNVGSQCEKTNLELAGIILDTLGKPRSLLKFVTDRAGHVRRHAVNPSKLMDRFGWRPAHAYPAALVETIRWYVAHEEWWRKIRDKSEEYKKFHRQYYRNR